MAGQIPLNVFFICCDYKIDIIFILIYPLTKANPGIVPFFPEYISSLILYIYPVSLHSAGIYKEKWSLTSSESLDATPAMPTFSFSLLTIAPFPFNRPIQNVPGIVRHIFKVIKKVVPALRHP